MSLSNIVDTYRVGKRPVVRDDAQKSQYSLFSEQYLEKPVMRGVYHAFRSPTMCTIKGVPAVDDF